MKAFQVKHDGVIYSCTECENEARAKRDFKLHTMIKGRADRSYQLIYHNNIDSFDSESAMAAFLVNVDRRMSR